MKYRIEDEFDVGATRYWEVFFDEDYNSALFEHIAIDRVLIDLGREGEGADLVIHRTQRLTPRREIPKVMRKFVKDAVTYVETNSFVARTNSMDVVTVPGFMSERITTRGTYRLEVIDEGRVRRVFDAECTCRIPLVGGAIEKQIVSEVEDSYRKTTAFTRRWLRDHP